MKKIRKRKWGFLIINTILWIGGGILILFNIQPIIGSIIFFFMGLVYYIFPKICYDYHKNSIDLIDEKEDEKDLISLVRAGSLLMMISGIGMLMHSLGFIFYIVTPFIVDYDAFYVGYMVTMVGLCSLGWFACVTSLELHNEYKEDRYDESEIKDFQRTSIESFMHNLILYVVPGGSLLVLALYHMGFFHMIENAFAIVFYIFLFGGFLSVIFPNAIDLKRIPSTRALTKLGGILVMIGSMGIIFLSKVDIMGELIEFFPKVILGLLLVEGIGILAIVGSQLDIKEVLGETTYNMCMRICAILRL